MTDEIYTVPQIKEKLYPVFTENKINKAILFGSYAKGTASKKSDIDLMVDSGLYGLKFVGFLGELCDALGKAVDLIDVRQITPGSMIEKEISKTGEVIYEIRISVRSCWHGR